MGEAKSFDLTASRRPEIKGLGVLVYDENAVSRMRLKDSLRGVEMVSTVSEMSTAGRVLEFLQDNPVDVIMVDEGSGGSDIYDTIKMFKQCREAEHAQVILVVESYDEDKRVKGNEAGVHGFLGRPFDIRRLEAALKEAMEKSTKPKPAARPHRPVHDTHSASPQPAAPAAAAPAGGAPDAMRDTLSKLRRLPIFTGFSDQDLMRLLQICKAHRLREGQTVFREGEVGHSLFVVVAGQVDIAKGENEGRHVLVSMHPGDCFGEMAIVDAEPRFADAVAASDATVIEVKASIVTESEDMLALKLVRQIAILLARKLRAQSR